MTRIVKATSFADPKDIARFKRCKELHGSDEECFKVGDNGIGYWDDDCSEGSGPSCAIPPEHMIEQFGSVDAARFQPVKIEYKGRSVIALIKDRMPHLRNIHNGASIDLNPDTCDALGIGIPAFVEVAYTFVGDTDE